MNTNDSKSKDEVPNERPREHLSHSLIRDLTSQLSPERINSNHEMFNSLTDAAATGGMTDDRQYLAERLVQALASLPEGSLVRDIGTGLMLKNLWDNLQHPPLSYMGEPYKYRTPDGSHNNVMFPHIGRSGSFYARSVTPKHVPTRLPEPGVIFDSLLAREQIPKEHPNKISSMLFAMATIIIHDLFRTCDKDPNIVDVSSYLDLSTLYGPNQETQDSVRAFTDGKLKPDTFAEVRLLGQPPESAALLICFNRYHNYVAEQLALINEAERFSLPTGINEAEPEAYKKAVSKRDNDIFQIARLVTNGLYVQCITNDYFRTILNLQRTDSRWNLNPREDYPEIFGQDNIEKGIGNQVSVEFNLIYRWHSVISIKNERWLNSFFQQLFPNIRSEDVTQPQFRAGMRTWAMQLPTDPGHRTFAGLERNSDGRFNDADLVKILTEATEDVAGSYGARRVPIALKAIEVLGIQQARRWGVATLNELRRHFGMLPHRTFTDINSNPDIATSLEALYGDPDNVELYPGVIVEEAKQPMIPGSGLCAGFTTTRAILSDAVALVRGDRFHTLDFSPVLLTTFGFKEVSNDTSIAGGGMMHRLLMRAFRKYHSNSIYAFYPFTVPSEMRWIMKTLQHEHDYDYTPPRLIHTPITVATWKGAYNVLMYSRTYKVPWGKAMQQLNDYEYMLSADTPTAAEQRRFVGRALYSPEKSIEEFSYCIETLTSELIRTYSHKLRESFELDIVKDVAALSWTRFAAHLFHIPLRDDKHSDAALDDRKLYELLSNIFCFTFLDNDPIRSFALRKSALSAYKTLMDVVKPACEAVKCHSFTHLLLFFGNKSEKEKLLPNHGIKLLERLLDSGKSVDQVASWVISMAAAVVVPSAQALSQITDFYLQEPYHSRYWPHIQQLASDASPSAPLTLRKYVLESLRLIAPVPALPRIAFTDTTIVDGPTKHSVRKDEVVILDMSKASRDPIKFPDPDEIKLDRSEDGYIHFGCGMHTCLGRYIAVAGLTEQMRILGKLKGLKRAPGNQGRLRSRKIGAVVSYLTDGADGWGPLPTSLKVHLDTCYEGKVL